MEVSDNYDLVAAPASGDTVSVPTKKKINTGLTDIKLFPSIIQKRFTSISKHDFE